MADLVQYRRDTAANWILNNPILASGEPALETDTGNVKVGDGVTTWKLLTYTAGISGVNYKKYRMNKNDSGTAFTKIQYKRLNNTLAAQSELSTIVDSNYTRMTVKYYDSLGTTVILTQIYDLTYNSEGDLINVEMEG